ncbi:MAG: TCP-1/cpn60 chaperonin family protein, partial [Dehalococcoidales bacterium]
LPVLDKLKLTGDEATGVKIVRKAILEPVRWIANNAGADGAVVVEQVRKSPKGIGYNAETDEYGDMVKMGIIDPTLVVRSALINGASIANMVLITEALVANIPEKAPPAPVGPEGY